MKYYTYISLFFILFSSEADFFAKQFDHIFLLKSTIPNNKDSDYTLEIVEILKKGDKEQDLAKKKIELFSKHVVRENARYIFAFNTEQSRKLLVELDGSGNFTFDTKNPNEKEVKSYKLNISDLRIGKPKK